MVRTPLAAALLAGAPALAYAQSASAPLVVTATVVTTCRVEVPRSAETSSFATMPIDLGNQLSRNGQNSEEIINALGEVEAGEKVTEISGSA